MNENTITLFRPVGQAELDLIRESGFTAFPPRLHWQPIFYPVCNEKYAVMIARDWNTKDEASGFVGYVTHFRVKADFIHQYETHIVGDSTCEEYWIPSGDMDQFNANIVGLIEVIGEYRP